MVDIIKEAILHLDLPQDTTAVTSTDKEIEKESVIEIGTTSLRWLCLIIMLRTRGIVKVDRILLRLV